MLLALLIASLGSRIADHAHAAAGLRSVHQIAPAANDDCSGFARAIYGREGITLVELPAPAEENGVTNIHRLAARRRALHRTPHKGDLVFFRNTTGRKGLTHIGIVDWVGRNGAATFVHRTSRGIVRSRINLWKPRAKSENDYVRGGRNPKLAGELVAGFASPERLRAVPMARTPRRR